MKRQKLKQSVIDLSSERELLSHTNTDTSICHPKTILAHTCYSLFATLLCTHLLATLHYSYLADADHRSAASFSRAPSARGRDASRHPVRARAARGLIELLACHAGWLRHVTGCTTLVVACDRQHSQRACTHTHIYI